MISRMTDFFPKAAENLTARRAVCSFAIGAATALAMNAATLMAGLASEAKNVADANVCLGTAARFEALGTAASAPVNKTTMEATRKTVAGPVVAYKTPGYSLS